MISVKDLKIRDPFIFFENGIYYLYSSGTGADGVTPVFVCRKSADLETFGEPEIVFEPHSKFWATKNYWAPELHKYNGKYYLFVSLKSETRTRGTQILVSGRPDGKFVPLTEYPVTPENWECLDGTLFVDGGVPYMVFCREWVEVGDGEIYIMPLTPDLKKATGEPKKLFSASGAKWVRSISSGNYVTDGPFIVKAGDTYKMIWSSFSEKGYAMGLAESKSLYGPWINRDEQLNYDDGGHGMVLNKDGAEYIVYHAPNNPAGSERMKLMKFDFNK